MRNKSIFVVLSTIVIVAGACRTAENSSDERPTVPAAMDDIAPNEARILATLTGIYSEPAASGPCAEAACRGVIRIDSVLGYGSSFPQPVGKGQHLEVRFAFTLEPTEDAGVTLDTPFPGIDLGESFWANLQGLPAPGRTNYTVHEYYLLDE